MVLGFLSEGSVPESEPDLRPSCSGSCTPPPPQGAVQPFLGRGGEAWGAVVRGAGRPTRSRSPAPRHWPPGGTLLGFCKLPGRTPLPDSLAARRS